MSVGAAASTSPAITTSTPTIFSGDTRPGYPRRAAVHQGDQIGLRRIVIVTSLPDTARPGATHTSEPAT